MGAKSRNFSWCAGSRRRCLAPSWPSILHQVPLVGRDDDAAAGLDRRAGDGAILVGRASASASMTSTTTSARSMARRASITLSVSTWPDLGDRGRPAGCPPCRRCGTACGATSAWRSTESRVVPGTSETIIRSSLQSRLTSDDLPALGRPTIATAVSRRSGSEVTRGAFGTCADDGVHQLADAHAVLGADLDDRDRSPGGRAPALRRARGDRPSC